VDQVAWGLDEWERRALAKLPPMVADYYAGGSRDEETLRANRSAWADFALRHRVLTDVSAVDLSAEIAGVPLSMPIVVAPTAFHGLAHAEAERATAAGAREAGTAMCLSTLSNAPVEEVAAAAGGALLFQLYVYKDRGATRAIVDRVREAGCRALVLTADAPVLGTRPRDVRNRFHLPSWLSLPNAAPSGRTVEGAPADSGLARYVAEQLDRSLGWGDLERLMAEAGLPVWLKGVVRGEDAAQAAGLGVAGLVVSNHGGRQLDAGIATAHALAEVVAAVDGRCPVWVDGGTRRGTDVAKALALGAAGVMVGRPVLWGLTVDGPAGVRDVLAGLRGELEEAMALMGTPEVSAVTADLCVRRT
jgi:4-hydroxymandelate oxidase